MFQLQDILMDIERLLLELKLVKLGYPQGDNRILSPLKDDSILKELLDVTGMTTNSDLADFYTRCNGLSMPDIQNGYFIHPIERVLAGFKGRDPNKAAIDGNISPILIFGSDGGGGLMALRLPNAGIYHLSVGTVRNRIFRYSARQIQLGADFTAFLMRLRDDAQNFINQNHDWNFIA
jgi:hypothetical protein